MSRIVSTHEAGGQIPASKPAPELSRLSGAGEISATAATSEGESIAARILDRARQQGAFD